VLPRCGVEICLLPLYFGRGTTTACTTFKYTSHDSRFVAVSIFYGFRYIEACRLHSSKVANFSIPRGLAPPWGWSDSKTNKIFSVRKLESLGLWCCLRRSACVILRLAVLTDLFHLWQSVTDRHMRTDTGHYIYHTSIASRGKKIAKLHADVGYWDNPIWAVVFISRFE